MVTTKHGTNLPKNPSVIFYFISFVYKKTYNLSAYYKMYCWK